MKRRVDNYAPYAVSDSCHTQEGQFVYAPLTIDYSVVMHNYNNLFRGERARVAPYYLAR